MFSSETLRMCFKIISPTIKRIGFAGRLLSEQYSSLNSSSNVDQNILLAKIKRGWLPLSVSEKLNEKDF
jgi:hypothetical protein